MMDLRGLGHGYVRRESSSSTFKSGDHMGWKKLPYGDQVALQTRGMAEMCFSTEYCPFQDTTPVFL